MKKIVLPALASIAVIGLSACNEPADTVVVEDETMEEPAMTEPVATDAMGEVEGDSVVIDTDGMDATVTDGDTTTTVDIDEDPSVAVETE
ncbi:hypothetical protein [Croceicoccus sp. Ery15]|uniref:hypothetical protein n=1 Tax=Croceicoccus sp. Ery15 TaxID=1703338 RepID=UPI001E41F604|nr:hypothetical protein [Croceicoccus sp. Ery15]